MTASQIAGHLDVTPRTIRHWAESGDLPKLDRGQYDVGWATWLSAGRAISTDWRGKISAPVAVAVGWVQAVGHDPKDADIVALGDLFTRNGLTFADAMQALGAAEARCKKS